MNRSSFEAVLWANVAPYPVTADSLQRSVSAVMAAFDECARARPRTVLPPVPEGLRRAEECRTAAQVLNGDSAPVTAARRHSLYAATVPAPPRRRKAARRRKTAPRTETSHAAA